MPVTGPNAIETHFIKEFGQNVELLLQQRGSKLRQSVMVESHKGEGAAFLEQIAAISAQDNNTRHGATPLIDPNTDRRWVYPSPKHVAIPLDKVDQLYMLADPMSKYSMAIVNALGREIDTEIIRALGGVAKTGKDGGTNVSLPGAQIIGNGSVGLTTDKLRQARKKLLKANVDLDNETAYFIGTEEMLEDLLQTTEATSADYNSVKALVNGDINTFMGFRFIWLSSGSNPGLVGTSEHFGFAYVPSGVHLGMWNDVTVRVDERPDLSYLTQIYGALTIGASRSEEEKVVRVAASV
jgi:hypothetical protein